MLTGGKGLLGHQAAANPGCLHLGECTFCCTRTFRTCSHAQVIDCANWGVSDMSQDEFFSLYAAMGCVGADEPPAMLKLKDWPARAHFRQRLPRHNQVRGDALPTSYPKY